MKKDIILLFKASIFTSIIMCMILISYTSIYNNINTGEDNSGISTYEALSKVGSRGEEVRKIQTKLKSLGLYSGNVDGIFGTSTAEAVKKYQSQKGLNADGVAGPQTIIALGIYSDSSQTIYKVGSEGNVVKQIQSKLKNLGYYTGDADGIYGSQTAEAVKKFQATQGLSADGIAGTQTISALGIDINVTEPPQSGNIDNDLYLLARIISAESRGEAYIGQVAVGAVVLNRVKHPSFPNSISGVIYQQGAFSAINDGQFNAPISESSYRAARDAMNGMDPSSGAIYYYNPAKTTNKWIYSRPVIKTIGSHVFAR